MSDDRDIKDTGRQIVELMEKLHTMPEYTLLMRIKSLEASLYVFHGNFKELKHLLVKHSDVNEAIRLRREGNKPEMRALLYEVGRRLHNFVTAVKSLVEHARNIHRDLYERDNTFPEYQQEVDRCFVHDPVSQFVEGLRNYCLHYELSQFMRVT